MNALLHTKALSVGYSGKALLRGIELELLPGELVAMIGVNGSGKSTLLRTVAGLLKPIAGEVMVDGKLLHQLSAQMRARLVSVVLTGRPDMGLLDVRTLISLGRQPWTGHIGRLSDTDIERVNAAMQQTGVLQFENRALRSLSDGELQLVMISRALAQDTPIMLLDEPTAFLDLVNRVRSMALLKDIAHRLKKLVLLSTHDLQTALDMADRIVLVADGAVICATPHELITSGKLTAVFSIDGMRFDPATSAFRPE